MFRVENFTKEISKCVEVDYFGFYAKYIDCNNSKIFCILPEMMKDTLKEIKDFKVYDDDIWIITNPKCGTTWTQEMVKNKILTQNLTLSIFDSF